MGNKIKEKLRVCLRIYEKVLSDIYNFADAQEPVKTEIGKFFNERINVFYLKYEDHCQELKDYDIFIIDSLEILKQKAKKANSLDFILEDVEHELKNIRNRLKN